jgi:hypothetical protein
MIHHFQYEERIVNIIKEINELNQEGIVFEFTKEEKYLNQYLALRKESYLTDKYMSGHFNKGMPDIYDYNSEIIIVRIKDKVIGGARMSCSYSHDIKPLPSESDEFSFKTYLKDFNIEWNSINYAEIHRFVINKEYRDNKNLSLKIILYLYMRAQYLNINYFFYPAIPLKARLFKRLCDLIGIKVTNFSENIFTSPKYNYIDMYISMVDIIKSPLYNFLYKQEFIDISNN